MKRHMISLKRVKILLALAGLTLFSITTVTIPSKPSSAQEHKLVKPEWLVMPKGYPEGFHGWGRIDYIGDNEIVINDIEYTLSLYVNYHTPTNLAYATKDLFVPGVLAGFLLNSRNDILSLWMITRKE